MPQPILPSERTMYWSIIITMLIVWGYSIKLCFMEMEQIRARLILTERVVRILENEKVNSAQE